MMYTSPFFVIIRPKLLPSLLYVKCNQSGRQSRLVSGSIQHVRLNVLACRPYTVKYESFKETTRKFNCTYIFPHHGMCLIKNNDLQLALVFSIVQFDILVLQELFIMDGVKLCKLIYSYTL